MRTLHNQLMRTWWLLAVLVVLCCFNAATLDVIAQTGEATESPYAPRQPLDCESFAALVDNATVEWQEMPGTHLIFIARLGEGERAGNLNGSRLKDIEDYLKRYKTIKYVTAEGSRIKGLGRIEIYVGGKLKTSIPVEKNVNAVCSGKVNPFL